MELSQYGETFEQLVSEMNEELDSFDNRVFTTLKKMERFASDKDDHLLSGYIYHNYAGAYYDHGNHEKVLLYTRKAITNLLRGNDRSLIARTYNLFALEAQRVGCFGIAYRYFKLAESFLQNEHDPFVKAFIQANIGDVLAEMGDFRQACGCIKKSITIFAEDSAAKKSKNALLARINLGLHSVNAGDLEGAMTALKRAEAFAEKYHYNADPFLGRWLLLLRAYITASQRRELETMRNVDEVIEKIVETHMFQDYMRETCRYCHLLISHKNWKNAGKLLHAIENNKKEALPAYSEGQLAQLKIAYYGATGEKKKMMAAYDERNRLDEIHRKDEMLMFYESVKLMEIVDELQSEFHDTMTENERLQKMVETDALVGIPNRYALSSIQADVFENAVQQGTSVGIGIVDIDAFKRYNDVHGHLAGDECLRRVAKVLERIASEHGIFVARYGGDEFVLIYENMTDEEIRHIEEQMHRETPISITHGFHNAVPDKDAKEWDFFMKADEILYHRKRKQGEEIILS